MKNFEWRELSFAYLETISGLSMMPYKFIVDRKTDIIFPFYDSNNQTNIIENINYEFVKLFAPMFNVDLTTTPSLFVFTPPIYSDCNPIPKIVTLIRNHSSYKNHNLFFFHSEREKEIFVKNNIFETKKCSYNTKIENITSIDDYISSLSQNARRNIKRDKLHFQDAGLKFESLEIEKYYKQMAQMYIQCCKKYGDIPEPVEIWDFFKSLDKDQVEWYGIFLQNELISFCGCFYNNDNAILSMYGRLDRDELLIKRSHAYFYLQYKMIEKCINKKVKVIYNGYGNYEGKKRFGYNLEKYYISAVLTAKERGYIIL